MRCSLVGRFKGQALLCGNDFAREILKLDDGRALEYEFPEGSFCHPNGSANERSESWLCGRAALIGGNLLELYCGAGTHTCALSKYFERVVAVEVDAKLVEAASRNLAANQCPNATVVVDSVGKRRGRLHSVLRKRAWDDVRFDCILVDPRGGAFDDATLGALAGFAHVLVVACNPEKLARDCDVIADAHAVAAFAVVDGEHTPHVAPAHFTRLSAPRRPRARFCVCSLGALTNSPTKTACETGPPRGSWRPTPTAATPTSGRSTAVTSTFDTADARRTNAQASSKAPGSRGWSSSSYFVASAAGRKTETVSTSPNASKIASVAPTPSVFRRNCAPRPLGQPQRLHHHVLRRERVALALNHDRLRTSLVDPVAHEVVELAAGRLLCACRQRLEARVARRSALSVYRSASSSRRATRAAARGPRPSSRRRRRGTTASSVAPATAPSARENSASRT